MRNDNNLEGDADRMEAKPPKDATYCPDLRFSYHRFIETSTFGHKRLQCGCGMYLEHPESVHLFYKEIMDKK